MEEFVPWAKRDDLERQEKMALDITAGVPMDECPAVITEKDREFFRRTKDQIQGIWDKGATVEIPTARFA
jgi:hypothetical protein